MFELTEEREEVTLESRVEVSSKIQYKIPGPGKDTTWKLQANSFYAHKNKDSQLILKANWATYKEDDIPDQ